MEHAIEPQGAGSLQARLRSGQRPRVTLEEQALAIAYTYLLKEEPRALTQVMDRIAQKPATHLCTYALKRLANASGYHAWLISV